MLGASSPVKGNAFRGRRCPNSTHCRLSAATAFRRPIIAPNRASAIGLWRRLRRSRQAADGESLSMTSYEGGCLCGRVRFHIAAAATDNVYCHCRMCQRNSGAPVVAWALFPATSLSWTTGSPTAYASSPKVQREFCADCGSHLVFRIQGSAVLGVNTTSLDDPSSFVPRMHIFTESRIPWFHTEDDLPQHAGYGPIRPPNND